MRKIVGIAALIAVPLIAIMGALSVIRWDIASVLIAVICCVPFLLSFENSKPSAGELVLTAVMTAFSAAGRFIFAPLPFFKPVTAIVVIGGMYLGAPAGFVIGAFSALISNIYFGQGAWTPFQMLCWGLIGAVSGVVGKKGAKPVFLCVTGIVAGFFYSLVMDVWSTLSIDLSFSLTRWSAAVITALPVTAVYCVSNVVFLLILNKPVGKRLERLKEKYGLFNRK